MIKTWQQRCEEHPDHNGIVTNQMIQARMQEEIDDLRAAIEQPRQWQDLTGEEIADLITAHAGFPLRLTEAVEAKLKEKNT